MISQRIRRFARIVKELFRMNILKTIVFNFKVLPFKEATKLPILLYGRVYLRDLSGYVEIKATKIRTGMIKIGYRWHDLFPVSFLPTQIGVSGKMIFNGECLVSGGVCLVAQHRDSVFLIGDGVFIGGGTTIKAMNSICVGAGTRITGECVIMDSNMHFVKDIATGEIAKNYGAIEIGHHCWVNSWSIISKGTVLPNYSVVARSSYLNRDYSEYGQNLFLVGSPAIVKGNSVQRILSLKKEEELSAFFRNNPSERYFHDVPGLFNDLYKY